MSKENYKIAIECFENNKKSMIYLKKATDSDVIECENELGIKLNEQYKDFVGKIGRVAFNGEEIFGIKEIEKYTLDERAKNRLPKNLVVIYDTESEEYFCLDFSKLNEEGEPQVVAYAHCVDVEYQTYEKIADDFGDFLLELLKRSEIYKEDNSNE